MRGHSKEMRHWWDEIMKEEKDGVECTVIRDDKVVFLNFTTNF